MLKAIRQQLNRWSSFKSQLQKESSFKYFVVDWTETIIIALILALIIRKYVIQSSVVPTGSMIRTLNIGDRLLVNKYVYRFRNPKRGEIVVFRSVVEDKKDYVKRCIGLPGDKISIKKGIVIVNGEPAIYPGVHIERDYFFMDEITVTPNEYYVMGDNRGHSYDSRFWGGVPRENFLGKALFTFYPIGRMRVLR